MRNLLTSCSAMVDTIKGVEHEEMEESNFKVQTSIDEEMRGMTEEEVLAMEDAQGGYLCDADGQWYSLTMDMNGGLFRNYI